eukprot:804162-Pelagomonas_calceolata.AAC.6
MSTNVHKYATRGVSLRPLCGSVRLQGSASANVLQEFTENGQLEPLPICGYTQPTPINRIRWYLDKVTVYANKQDLDEKEFSFLSSQGDDPFPSSTLGVLTHPHINQGKGATLVQRLYDHPTTQ